MRLVVGTEHPDVLRAVRQAEIDPWTVVTRTGPEFHHESTRASISVLDLRSTSAPCELIARLLGQHPFLQLNVIADPRQADPEVYFNFGRMGVANVIPPDTAARPEFWLKLAQQQSTINVVDRFERLLRPHLSFREHPLITVFLPKVHLPSVKQLAHTLMPNRQVSEAARRRTLWSVCQRAQLVPADRILSGLRVLFIKYALDDKAWTMEQLTQHLQFSSPRAMWRTVRRRCQLNQAALRAADFTALTKQITHDFVVRRSARRRG